VRTSKVTLRAKLACHRTTPVGGPAAHARLARRISCTRATFVPERAGSGGYWRGLTECPRAA
jgi:hypothetical protein